MQWSDPAAFMLSAYKSPGFKHKKLDRYAASASRLHPRVGDWICAAPILATMLADQRHYQGLYDLACSGGRCVDALRVCHIPTPMRKQTTTEADHWHSLPGWRFTFPEMPESELAQLLKAYQTKEQRFQWTKGIAWAMKARPPGADFGDFARWAVRMSAKEPLNDVMNFIHFMKENEFDLNWTVGQLKRAHHAWVERMRVEWELRREERAEAADRAFRARVVREEKALDQLTECRPFPSVFEHSIGKATVLNTPRMLLDEGSAMRHCVGGSQFRQAMRKGRAIYFHLEAGAERSTLEIQKHGERFLLGQHCGPCNARPSQALQHLASCLFQHGLKSADQEKSGG